LGGCKAESLSYFWTTSNSKTSKFKALPSFAKSPNFYKNSRQAKSKLRRILQDYQKTPIKTRQAKSKLCCSLQNHQKTPINSKQTKSKLHRSLQNHQKIPINSRQAKSKLRHPKWDKENIDNKDLVSTTNQDYNMC